MTPNTAPHLHRPSLRRVAAALASIAALPLAIATAAPTPATAASATRVPRAVSAIGHAERSEVVLINRYRRAHGLRPLRIDGTLSRAAGWMALDMGRNGRFSHTDSRGRDPFSRLRAFGYPSSDTWRGENLAAGNAGPAPTLRQWIASPPHRANMLGRTYRAIGIARVHVAGSPYRWYWATTFGSRWTRPA
jgi:uncharacterized protein YkwD